jgi:hypothetical protein
MFFKKRQQRRAIEKLKKTRVPEFVPFNAARRVAFILEADEAGISEAADSLISVLKENKADWRAIVIDFDKKNTADFSEMENFDIIRKCDFNFYGLPKFPLNSWYTEKECDLLLDFSREYSFTSEYIARQVNARLKAGRYSTGDESAYDFITPPADTSAISFLRQTIFFLNSIKPAN